MAQPKVNVKFEAKGQKALLNAIKQLNNSQKLLVKNINANNVALKRLTVSQKSYNTQGIFGAKGNRLLANSFATLRSKMLLVAFGAGIVTKVFLDQVRAFAKQEQSVRRLSSVFGSEAAQSLDEYSSKLQENSRFGDENINILMAQIGAFGANEEQTKQLTQATLDLAEGMGLDLNSAGLLVAKTIGSTTDALGRYGVGADGATTKSEKVANVVASIEKKFGGLAAAIGKTTEGQLAQASNAFGDAGEALGGAFAPMVLLAAKAVKAFSEAISFIFSSKLVKTFTASLVAAGIAASTLYGATILYGNAAKIAAAGQVLFNAAVSAIPYVIAASAIGALTAGLLYYFDFFEQLTEEEKKALEQKQQLIIKNENLRKSQEQGADQLQKELDLLNAKNDAEKMAINLGHEASDLEIKLIGKIVAKKEEIKLLKKESEDAAQAQLTLAQNIEQAWLSTEEGGRQAVEAQIKQAEELKEKLIGILGTGAKSFFTNPLSDEILSEDDIKKVDTYIKELNESLKKIDTKPVDTALQDMVRFSAGAMSDVAGAFVKDAKKRAQIQYTAAVVDAIAASSKAFENAGGYPAGIPMAALTLAKGMAIAENVRSAGAAIGSTGSTTSTTGIGGGGTRQIVFGQPAPQFADGGLIGGRSHSQGGTMINAERGEFIMSKNAVDSIGLDTLNNLNQGGTAVTVNVSGNVMTQDFVDNDLADAIKDAVRRGSDFGIG